MKTWQAPSRKSCHFGDAGASPKWHVASVELRRASRSFIKQLHAHNSQPKHGIWLNQAEIAINLYACQCLGKRLLPDIGQLRLKTGAWARFVNERAASIE